MTVLAGHIAPSAIGGPDFAPTPDLSVRNTWTSSGNLAVGASSPLVGAITANAPIEMHPGNLSGVLATSFTREEYGRVVALPSDVDLGTVPDGAEVEIELWNAALAAATCSNAIESELDGITHNAPAIPFSLNALASRVVTYVIGPGGPVNIAATHTFVFSSGHLTVSITGARAVILMVWPQDGIVEKLAWLTDIITAWTGGEQRAQVRMEPRRSFKMIFWPATRASAQRLENMTQAWRANHWSLPLYTEAERLTAAPAAGTYAISVDTSRMTLAAGDMAMVWWSEDSNQTLTVESLTTGSITFGKPLAPPANHTGPVYAIPVHSARLASAPTKERRPAFQDKWTMEFLLDEDRDVPDALPLPQYLDLDVFVFPTRFLQSATQPVTYTRVTSELDYSSGKCYFASLSDYTAQQIQVDIVAIDRAAAFTAHQFFARRVGRCIPFWYPLYDADMTPTKTIGANDTLVVVADRRFAMLNGHATRQHLYIETYAGAQYFRQITSITAGDDGYEVLATNNALGVEVAPAQIRTMCFLGLFRLDEDEVEMTWSTAPALKTSMMVLEVAA